MNEQEEKCKKLLDDAPVIVYLTAPDTSCIFLNRRWYEFTGQAPGAGLGTGWTNVIHPDDRAATMNTFRVANEKREAHRLDYRLRSKDRNYRWFIDTAAPRFSPEGEFLGFVGTVIDINDRRYWEEQLRASEERYRYLFNSIDEGFCAIEMIFDDQDQPTDFRYLEVNPSFEKLVGFSGAKGRTAKALNPNLDKAWCRIYGKVALTGEPIRFEHADPTTGRWFNVFAFRMDRPEQRRVAVLFSDESERKIRELNTAFLAEVGIDFARASNPRELLQNVGRKLCRHLRVGSAAFAEIDEADTLQSVSQVKRTGKSATWLTGVAWRTFLARKF